ncbi:hypothetical protein PAXRUDRAFT_821328 [Paxillus rubicundulus Ve08.2h10]|uniref:Uncharacterized protein n=1 Tax=Paxillus rubicundulus Ve08.2h10 TaxID=930991 RepID=A0A0D0ED98_9AGAM|nr:hypothetical protein PAXRUDRAFT_821328 [Paxillus rubicundulus Ve08.2h10]
MPKQVYQNDITDSVDYSSSLPPSDSMPSLFLSSQSIWSPLLPMLPSPVLFPGFVTKSKRGQGLPRLVSHCLRRADDCNGQRSAR